MQLKISRFGVYLFNPWCHWLP